MPFKSSLAQSAGKLIGVFNQSDLSLRGATQSLREEIIESVNFNLTNGTNVNAGGKMYFIWTANGGLSLSGPALSFPQFKVDYVLVAGGGGGGGFSPGGYFGGASGTNSTAFGVTVAGGGAGGRYPAWAGGDGGSGGGGGAPGGTAGSGNTPSLTPSQGNPGGTGATGGLYGGAGGGGAGQAGQGGQGNSSSGYGGYGKSAFSGDTDLPTSYGTPGPTAGRWFAGGGGGAGGTPTGAHNAAGGAGGGGDGRNTAPTSSESNATANTGGGGGAYVVLSGGGAGGGGAGGYIEASAQPISTGPYPITIGSGGTPTANLAKGAAGIFILRLPAAAQLDPNGASIDVNVT